MGYFKIRATNAAQATDALLSLDRLKKTPAEMSNFLNELKNKESGFNAVSNLDVEMGSSENVKPAASVPAVDAEADAALAKAAAEAAAKSELDAKQKQMDQCR